MSHTCPDCGQDCYCHGDIDDCPVEDENYAYEHCVGCGDCGGGPHDHLAFGIDDESEDADMETYLLATDESYWLENPR